MPNPLIGSPLQNNEKASFWDAVCGNAPLPPIGQLLGWRSDAKDGDAEFGAIFFQARHEFLNPFGAVQGGILSAMLDDTMGPILYATLPAGAIQSTIEMKVAFIKPARPGQIRGQGRVIHKGRRIAFMEGQLYDVRDELLATASASYRIFKEAGGIA
jgi:uncharacterized protein (TIGR00369 family)